MFPLHRESQLRRHTLFIAHIGTHQSERAQFHLCRQMPPCILRRQSQRLDGEHRRIRRLPCRNKDIVVVADGQRQLTHIVQRVARDINLPTLTVAQHHPVVADTRMPGPVATHRHRLHTARAPVVPQRDARDIMQRVGHVRHPQPLKLFPFQQMERCRTSRHPFLPRLRHRHPLQSVSAVRQRISIRRLCGSR